MGCRDVEVLLCATDPVQTWAMMWQEQAKNCSIKWKMPNIFKHRYFAETHSIQTLLPECRQCLVGHLTVGWNTRCWRASAFRVCSFRLHNPMDSSGPPGLPDYLLPIMVSGNQESLLKVNVSRVGFPLLSKKTPSTAFSSGMQCVFLNNQFGIFCAYRNFHLVIINRWLLWIQWKAGFQKAI